ncbi:hypothetical protein G9A89_000915 [Geosiphon pyriformis]|nr:hypothetical protein G9A89_000915 [Geosiphon pyriformis]
MTQFHGYAAFDKEAVLAPWSYTPKPLADDEVEVEISHCGICGSDLHTITGGWGPIPYPMIVGHEIIGKIVKVGSKVTQFKVGDRAGVGCQISSCQTCQECTNRFDQICSKKVFTYDDTWKDQDGKPTQYRSHGGYADRIRTQAEFAFHIPEEINSAEAAPLLCAGVTIYTPLKRYDVKSGKKVGIVGIGGLGHLGVQFAAKMGSEVTAISHSDKKRDDAIKLGATNYLNISDKDQVSKFSETFDIILSTTFGQDTDWGLFLSLIKNHGKLILIGVPESPLSLSVTDLLRFITIEASLIGSRHDVKEMLAFAAKHDVRPWIQTVPMKDVNDALDIMRSGKARYRIVLER